MNIDAVQRTIGLWKTRYGMRLAGQLGTGGGVKDVRMLRWLGG